MNLPLILDIAIGLIFIYLILSLLASEIQEFIATVFQWRAKHLKESIENLLAGDSKDPEEIKRAIELANKLYANPLLENINQEAKGQLVKLPRSLTWKIGDLYRLITTGSRETVFGSSKHTGPSYIPSETFATTLLETLKIPILVQQFSESKLKEFQQNLLKDIKDWFFLPDGNPKIAGIDNDSLSRNVAPSGEPAKSLLKQFHKLEDEYNKILEDFINNTATLEITIERMKERLEKYISGSKPRLSGIDGAAETFDAHMQSLTERFEENERNVLLRGLRPSLDQVVKIINIDRENLPQSVRESILALAHRAQSRVEIIETDINQLREEIELWFDRSMERASGVYKRNAKGAAIVIGFLIAIAANGDTFYMVSRLSTDRDLRNVIAQNAQMVNEICSPTTPTSAAAPTGKLTPAPALTATQTSQEYLDCVRNQTESVLKKVSLPFGWSTDHLKNQWNFPYQNNPTNWPIWSVINVLLPISLFTLLISSIVQIVRIILEYPYTKLGYFWLAWLSFFTVILVIFTGVKVIFGWLLSALAISMGASFWFDLLSKVINVRNTGPKPASSDSNQPVSTNTQTIHNTSTRSNTQTAHNTSTRSGS
jgi:uncharacterized protein involved in cysteine biosynthesis